MLYYSKKGKNTTEMQKKMCTVCGEDAVTDRMYKSDLYKPEEWQEILQVMKSKGLQPRLLYPARLSLKMEGEIRSFSNKRWLKEYTSTKPALQERHAKGTALRR